MDSIVTIAHDNIITGHLNFHIDNKFDVDTSKFCSILDCRGLKQHIEATLNMVVSRESSSIIAATCSVYDPCLSKGKSESFGDQ